MHHSARIAASLLLVFAAAAAAADPYLGVNRPVKGDDHVSGVPFDGGRPPGETIDDPLVIPELPFFAEGNSCGFAEDYDEMCPYSDMLAPDLVYLLQPNTSLDCVVDLCASLYDTKVYIYDFDAGYGFGIPLACNDDAGCGYSGYQSKLNVFFEQGRTYYIVIDGYGGDCGTYTLDIHEVIVPPPLVCPPGAIAENEPDCYDNYVDQTNGGCQTHPIPVFTPLEPTPGGAPFAVCGTGGTYLYNGMSYRDTDWYELHVAETSTITYECEAEFPIVIVVLHAINGCLDWEILDSDIAGPTPEAASITRVYEPGIYWFWNGASVFTGVPCGSLYVMTVSGYAEPGTPVDASSWGGVKTLFR